MRLHLRPVRADDAPRLLAWRNSAGVSAFMYTDHVIGEAEHADWMAAVLARQGRRDWVVELDAAPVGLANLVRIDERLRRCEWAFYLADPAVRGRGVGGAVEYLVVAYVFETLKLNKLWCEVLAGNTAVIHLHERFGFTREALFRDHVRKGGAFHDVVGLGMLQTEWPAAKAAAEARLAVGGGLAGLTLEG